MFVLDGFNKGKPHWSPGRWFPCSSCCSFILVALFKLIVLNSFLWDKMRCSWIRRGGGAHIRFGWFLIILNRQDWCSISYDKLSSFVLHTCGSLCKCRFIRRVQTQSPPGILGLILYFGYIRIHLVLKPTHGCYLITDGLNPQACPWLEIQMLRYLAVILLWQPICRVHPVQNPISPILLFNFLWSEGYSSPDCKSSTALNLS